jgi:hypothetical protein
MPDFCVADVANSQAIRGDQRLEFEHFESDRHGWRKCERIAGAILAQLIPPTN